MKDRRGPLGRTVGAVAQGLAGAARRRQLEPRALTYDATGDPQLVPAGTSEHQRLVETAARLLATGRGRVPEEEEAEDATDEAGPGELPL